MAKSFDDIYCHVCNSKISPDKKGNYTCPCCGMTYKSKVLKDKRLDKINEMISYRLAGNFDKSLFVSSSLYQTHKDYMVLAKWNSFLCSIKVILNADGVRVTDKLGAQTKPNIENLRYQEFSREAMKNDKTFYASALVMVDYIKDYFDKLYAPKTMDSVDQPQIEVDDVVDSNEDLASFNSINALDELDIVDDIADVPQEELKSNQNVSLEDEILDDEIVDEIPAQNVVSANDIITHVDEDDMVLDNQSLNVVADAEKEDTLLTNEQNENVIDDNVAHGEDIDVVKDSESSENSVDEVSEIIDEVEEIEEIVSNENTSESNVETQNDIDLTNVETAPLPERIADVSDSLEKIEIIEEVEETVADENSEIENEKSVEAVDTDDTNELTEVVDDIPSANVVSANDIITQVDEDDLILDNQSINVVLSNEKDTNVLHVAENETHESNVDEMVESVDEVEDIEKDTSTEDVPADDSQTQSDEILEGDKENQNDIDLTNIETAPIPENVVDESAAVEEDEFVENVENDDINQNETSDIVDIDDIDVVDEPVNEEVADTNTIEDVQKDKTVIDDAELDIDIVDFDVSTDNLTEEIPENAQISNDGLNDDTDVYNIDSLDEENDIQSRNVADDSTNIDEQREEDNSILDVDELDIDVAENTEENDESAQNDVVEFDNEFISENNEQNVEISQEESERMVGDDSTENTSVDEAEVESVEIEADTLEKTELNEPQKDEDVKEEEKQVSSIDQLDLSNNIRLATARKRLNSDSQDDRKKAMELIKEQSKLEIPEAMFVYGYCWDNGICLVKNPKNALSWYKKAFEAGLLIAEKDIERIEEYLANKEKTPKTKVSDTALEDGIRCYNAKDYDKACIHFRNACQRKDNLAYFYYAICMEYGLGSPINPEEAFKYYSLAVKSGNTNAIFYLAQCYFKGFGCAKDPLLAYKYYKKAADLGNVNAEYKISICYKHGFGVEKNPKNAFKWALKAAEHDVLDAINDVAWYYVSGTGVKQDYANAYAWFKKASDRGDASAMYNLAICYEQGYGIEANEQEALKLYRKSAKLGNASAKQRLKQLKK